VKVSSLVLTLVAVTMTVASVKGHAAVTAVVIATQTTAEDYQSLADPKFDLQPLTIYGVDRLFRAVERGAKDQVRLATAYVNLKEETIEAEKQRKGAAYEMWTLSNKVGVSAGSSSVAEFKDLWFSDQPMREALVAGAPGVRRDEVFGDRKLWLNAISLIFSKDKAVAGRAAQRTIELLTSSETGINDFSLAYTIFAPRDITGIYMFGKTLDYLVYHVGYDDMERSLTALKVIEQIQNKSRSHVILERLRFETDGILSTSSFGRPGTMEKAASNPEYLKTLDAVLAKSKRSRIVSSCSALFAF
jgi:hypothetical protein